MLMVYLYRFSLHMYRIFPFFLCSEMYSNYQVDILTSTHISVADILYNEMAMFYFMEVYNTTIIS